MPDPAGQKQRGSCLDPTVYLFTSKLTFYAGTNAVSTTSDYGNRHNVVVNGSTTPEECALSDNHDDRATVPDAATTMWPMTPR